MQISSDKIKAVIVRIKNLKRDHILTDYEATVVESLVDFASARGYLTEKQVNFFGNIENNYTPELIEARQGWLDSFNDQKKEMFMIAANYYNQQGTYFLAAVTRALKDPDYVPGKKEYQKIVENKYAQKVLKAHYKVPKFCVGEMVFPVSKATPWLQEGLRRGGIVLRANAKPICSSAKGAKRYLVLPIGDPHGIIVEERWLKTRRDAKNGNLGKSKKKY